MRTRVQHRLILKLTMVLAFVISSLTFAGMQMNGSVLQGAYMLDKEVSLASNENSFGTASAQAALSFPENKKAAEEAAQQAAAEEAAKQEAARQEAAAKPSSSRQIVMEATAYTAAEGSGTGLTATGQPLQRGMVAVDPDVIPLGTQLYVEGYGYAVAADTGGAIVGNHIDLAMDSVSEALDFGRQQVVVHIL